MPLTIAYPAAVIPLRRRLVFSALVIGSMMPDFARLFRVADRTWGGHTWIGILWFCIPLGLLSLFFFHHLLKKPLFLLLPENHQKCLVPYLADFSFFPGKRFLLIIFSLAVGAATHITWDIFTDSSGWAVRHVLVFRQVLFEIPGQPVRLFKVLHHGSTIVGLAIIILCYLRFLKTAPKHSLHSVLVLEGKMKMVFFTLASCVAVFGGMVFAIMRMDSTDGSERLQWIEFFIRRAAIACGVIACLEILAFSTAFSFWVRDRSKADKARN